jgi:protein-tyrosine phosphatase
MSQILSYLYLGSAEDAFNKRFLETEGITHVLNVAREIPQCRCLFYKYIPLDDTWSQNINVYFPITNDYISNVEKTGGKVLVHCAAGVSRSAAIVIAYLMWREKVPMGDAYEFVKARRSIISPNLHFMGQLMTLQKSL